MADTEQSATRRKVYESRAKINDYYNQEDLQQLFGFGRDKMHRFLLSGLLPTVKVGGRYYISKEAFDRWMRNNAGKVIDF